MKLAIVLFLFSGLEALGFAGERFSENGKLNKYIGVEQDATAIKQKIQERPFVSTQTSLPVLERAHREGPVIRMDTPSPVDGANIPIQNSTKEERAYAVLPNGTLSLP